MLVCCAIFESDLSYAFLVWAQNTNSVKILYLLQKKPHRAMLFQSRNFHAGPLFRDLKMFKFFDKAALETAFLETNVSRSY